MSSSSSLFIYHIIFVLISYKFFYFIQAVPIDNGIIDKPEIGCEPIDITVSFSTKNAFYGHVYIKGRYDEPGCR